jgi:hypothetical protein
MSGDAKDPGSLPHAVEQANAAPDSTIVFQSGLPGTIPLAASLSPKAAMTIIGPGSGVLAVQGAVLQPNSNSPLVVNGGVTVSVSGRTITGGSGVNQPRRQRDRPPRGAAALPRNEPMRAVGAFGRTSGLPTAPIAPDFPGHGCSAAVQ